MVVFLCIVESVMPAQSLVNKSAPATQTIINPTGKRAPAINLTRPGFVSPVKGMPPATTKVKRPPRAIKAPPQIANNINLRNGISDFAFDESAKICAISAGW